MSNDRPPVCAGLARLALRLLPACRCSAGFAAGASVEGFKMKKRPTLQKAESSALNSVNFTVSARFTGTDNPRHLRTIQALMTRPITREHLDQIAGCSNGPELIAELRRRGLNVPCTRTKKKDRDLFDCWPGVYHFTQADRRRVLAWMARRGGAAHASD